MATILVLIFSTMATTEENYKVTPTSLALLVRRCDHSETVASLFWLGGGQQESTTNRKRGENIQMPTSNPQDTVRGECFSSAQITNQNGFFMSWLKLSLGRYL